MAVEPIQTEGGAVDDAPIARRRLPRWATRLLLGALAVLIGVGAAFGVYATSVQPGAAIVKAVFETGAEVTPPAGFAAIESSVSKVARVPIPVPGIPTAHLDLYAPTGSVNASLPVILWIHGGGFISSSADTVRDYAILLAHEGYLVANLDYSLAPAARYPVPVEQANAALAWLRHGAAAYSGDATRTFIGGDSAGAQIASELGAVQTNPTLAANLHLAPGAMGGTVRGMILFCGLYDMRTVGATGFPALRTYLWAYTGSRQWTDFTRIDQLSTTGTATADYPPTFITVGDKDPFHPQASELAGALRRDGVPVTTLFWGATHPGLGHEYQFDFAKPQAKTAFAATLKFLAERSAR